MCDNISSYSSQPICFTHFHFRLTQNSPEKLNIFPICPSPFSAAGLEMCTPLLRWNRKNEGSEDDFPLQTWWFSSSIRSLVPKSLSRTVNFKVPPMAKSAILRDTFFAGAIVPLMNQCVGFTHFMQNKMNIGMFLGIYRLFSKKEYIYIYINKLVW